MTLRRATAGNRRPTTAPTRRRRRRRGGSSSEDAAACTRRRAALLPVAAARPESKEPNRRRPWRRRSTNSGTSTAATKSKVAMGSAQQVLPMSAALEQQVTGAIPWTPTRSISRTVTVVTETTGTSTTKTRQRESIRHLHRHRRKREAARSLPVRRAVSAVRRLRLRRRRSTLATRTAGDAGGPWLAVMATPLSTPLLPQQQRTTTTVERSRYSRQIAHEPIFQPSAPRFSVPPLTTCRSNQGPMMTTMLNRETIDLLHSTPLVRHRLQQKLATVLLRRIRPLPPLGRCYPTGPALPQPTAAAATTVNAPANTNLQEVGVAAHPGIRKGAARRLRRRLRVSLVP